MFSHMNEWKNERERERERERETEGEWGDLEKGQKVERKDTRSSMFGNCNNILYRFTLPQIYSLKYAPVTSCDVEESFCMLKSVQSDKRMSLNEHNLEKVVVHCFTKNINVK